ncbi:MAG: arabinose isomerase [Bacteroidaceae bacterium]
MKIGLMAIGLNTYWRQYEGLLPRLISYTDEIGACIENMQVDVLHLGMVDSMEKTAEATERLRQEHISLLCVFVSTYALSSTVLPVVKEAKCPVLLLNIQPTAAIDYTYLNALGDRAKMTGEWLAHCQACSIPELSCVLTRAGVQYDILTGHLKDEETWQELREWIQAVAAVEGMKANRMGLLGHYYSGMLDVYSDLTRLSAVFGTRFDTIEIDELKVLRDQVNAGEIREKLNEFQKLFKVSPQCESVQLESVARTSVALDKMVEGHRLDSLVYYYEGTPGNEHEQIITTLIPGNTLLTGKGIPTAGEYEVKNAHAMKLMALLGAGGSFSEPYAMDFDDDVILWGHDGPGHWNMAQDGVKLVPLPSFHGKPGNGLSIQMSVKQGDVTLLSVCEGKEGIHLLVAEGESVAGETLHIGNTNSRYRFPLHVKEFMNRWSKGAPSHHCAIGVGHQASRIEKIGYLLGINVIRIC